MAHVSLFASARSCRFGSASLSFVVALALCLPIGSAAPLFGQESGTPTEEAVEAGSPGSATRGVEKLLDRLAMAGSRSEASRLERRILLRWARSDSDTVDLLMEWAAGAMQEKDYETARTYLDRVVQLRPDFAEGWNRRATVFYMLDDYTNAITDIGHVLSLQPRHFGAINGLGLVLQELDEDERALRAFRKALEIHPFIEGAEKRIEKLSRSVEGLPI